MNQKLSIKQSIIIISTFGLFGGILGGLITFLGAVPAVSIVDGINFFDNVGESVSLLILFLYFGAILGLIPALLTAVGIIISRNVFNVVDINKKYLFFMGFSITIGLMILVSLVVSIVDGMMLYRFQQAELRDVFKLIGGTLFFGCVGGVISLILGRLALPKVKI